MANTHLRGLTWDHPRAIAPLHAARDALRVRFPEVTVTWDVQPLSGFESHPMAETTAIYDLIIFDHPHVGDVAAHGLLLPVNDLLKQADLADSHFVGPSLASYRYRNQVWALPLDAACQVSCARPELMLELDAPFPATWTRALELGERALREGYKLAIAYSPVHSLMVFLTLCANQGAPLAESPARNFIDRLTAKTTLTAMKELLRFCPAEVLDWDSIALQNAMCARDDLVFCPAVYGFSPYSRRSQNRLVYGNLAALQAGSGGSTLGGTGLGISARSRNADAASQVAAFLIEAPTQENIVARHDGQPARAEAWESAQVNRESNHFYLRTRDTIERAWVRPRFDGYLNFQRDGGKIVEQFLRGKTAMESALDDLEGCWSDCLSAAFGDPSCGA